MALRETFLESLAATFQMTSGMTLCPSQFQPFVPPRPEACSGTHFSPSFPSRRLLESSNVEDLVREQIENAALRRLDANRGCSRMSVI